MSGIVESFKIQGMSCNHCIHAVREALGSLEDVTVGDVQIGTAQVSYTPNPVKRAEIVRAIENEGYAVSS